LKHVIYTAVFGGYDLVASVDPRWQGDFVCFTDNPQLVAPGWRVITVALDSEIPADANRRYKMRPHHYLKGYSHSLYVDGNIRIAADPEPLFRKYLTHGAIAIPKHPRHDCAYEEARACIAHELVDRTTAEQQMARYEAEGFPVHFGLTANGILLRRHLDDEVIDLMDAWWSEYCNGAKRDQLSLQYCAWKKQIQVAVMHETAHTNLKYFRLTVHRGTRRESIAGQLVDYIACNRYRNVFFRTLHGTLHRFSKNSLMRRLLR